MRKFNLFLMCGLLLTAMFLVAGCNNNEPEIPEIPEVPNPEGTVEIWMRDADNGSTWVIPEAFTGGFGINNQNFVWQALGTPLQFASVGEVNSLGEVTEIPTSGWANQIAIFPGHGYIVRQNANYTRMYVADWITNTAGDIVGARIMYQSPFKNAEPDADTFVFEADGGSRSFVVLSNDDWVITRTDNDDWYALSALSGSRSELLTITVNENETVEERNTTLIFGTGGIEFATVGIRQEAGPPFINLDKNMLNFEYAGGSQTIEISSNYNWTISDTPSWIIVSTQSGEGNTTVTVTASENELAVEREVALTFRSGTQTATVEVTQEAAPPFIEINRNTLNFECTGGSQTIQISSNGNWTVASRPNWITLSLQSATGNAMVAVSVTENTLAQERTSLLTFNNGTQSDTVRIIQRAPPPLLPNVSNSLQGVVINGIRWATRNVDAPGTFASAPEASGMFYQWNRRVGWSSTDPMINFNGGTVWDSSTPTGSIWERANDPCPQGWRVPTQAEIQTLSSTANVSSQWGRMANGVRGRMFTDIDTGNTLFLPAAGWRNHNFGALNTVGTVGYYWSSTVNGAARHLNFNSGSVSMYNTNRALGFSVRCVAE